MTTVTFAMSVRSTLDSNLNGFELDKYSIKIGWLINRVLLSALSVQQIFSGIFDDFSTQTIIWFEYFHGISDIKTTIAMICYTTTKLCGLNINTISIFILMYIQSIIPYELTHNFRFHGLPNPNTHIKSCKCTIIVNSCLLWMIIWLVFE